MFLEVGKRLAEEMSYLCQFGMVGSMDRCHLVEKLLYLRTYGPDVAVMYPQDIVHEQVQWP